MNRTTAATGRVSQRTAVCVVYVAGLFLSVLDTTIVNVALPAIGRAFAVAPTAVDTVSISYLVSLAVFVPASGWLGDRFGGKRTLLAAIAVFTGGSALCGMASSLGELVAFRVLQGVGGGMLVSVGMAMLLRTFAPEERVRASAILSIANGFAPTLGPVLGGLLVTDVSWRAIFYVNVPVGVFAVVFGALYLRNEPARPAERFDARGFLLAAAGLGLLMYGISEGPTHGWTSAAVIGSIGGGAVLVAAMVAVERRAQHPVMDIRLLANRLLSSGSTVMTVESAAFLGTVFTVTLYFQDERRMSALASGLSTFPEAIGIVLGSQLASRFLYRALRPRRHLILGVLGTSTAVALMALLDAHSSIWWARLLLFVMGLAVGQVFVGTQSASFATVPDSSAGRASTLFNVGRRLGGALGVAIASSVLTAVTAGYRSAFLVAAGFNLVGLIAAWRIDDAEAAASIPRPRRKDRGTGNEPKTPATRVTAAQTLSAPRK